MRKVTLKDSNPRFGRILTGMAISLGTLVAVLASLELIGYLWELRTAQGPLGWTLIASRRIEMESLGTAEHPYHLMRPNMTYFWEGIPVAINSRGLRDIEPDPDQPGNVYHVLNLGDSVVFGWKVRLEDTYGKVLEASLNARQDGRQYLVINAGIPTWNLVTERNFLLEEGLGYRPDMVIVDVTLVNDVYARFPDVFEPPGLFTWLRDNTYAWPFLTTQARFLLSRRVGPEAFPTLNPPTNSTSYFPRERDHPAWEQIRDLLTEMRHASETAGAEFLVVVFPTAFQINAAGHPDLPQQIFQEWEQTGDFEVVDLLPVYAEACRQAGILQCEGYENLLFADVWMHPNTLGHRLAAETIRENQFLGD